MSEGLILPSSVTEAVTGEVVSETERDAGELTPTREERDSIYRVLDAHDEALIEAELEGRALKTMLYQFPGEGGQQITDLSHIGVTEAVRSMNATQRARVTVDKDSLEVVVEQRDRGFGLEDFYVATVYAVNELTGQGYFGTSTEPVLMRISENAAKKRRSKGETISEDRRVFDQFARAKAIVKAQRNALRPHIPEKVRQALIAQFVNDPNRVKQLTMDRSAEQIADRPAALTDDEGKALIDGAKAVFVKIREVDRTALFPGRFHALLMAAWHDHDRLRDFIAWLEQLLKEVRETQEQAA